MKHSSAIIFSLVVIVSSVADANNVSHIFERYHDLDGDDKCASINNATDHVAYLKSAGAPKKDFPAIISGDPSISSEDRNLYFLMADIAFSTEYIDKERFQFVSEIEQLCGLSHEEGRGQCDDLVKAASAVVEYKDREEVSSGVLLRLMREVASVEEFWGDGTPGVLHFDMLNMSFWPEHIEKSPEEFTNYVEDVWCKIPEIERSKTFSANRIRYGHDFMDNSKR